MNCQEFNNELQKMLDTGITQPAAELTSHMERCQSCSTRFAKVVLLLGEIAREKSIAPPFFLQSKIMEKVLKEGQRSLSIRPIHWYTAAASIAAGIMLGLIIGNTTYAGAGAVSASATSEITLQQASYSTPMDDYIFSTDTDK